MTSLLTDQDNLQKQALQAVEASNLKDVLSQYGQFSLVGSIEYGLMTWRDIDINLVMKTDPTDDQYWNIVKSIFSSPNVKSLTLVDNRQLNESNRPKSMYIGIRFQDSNKDVWKFDIRLLSHKHVATNETQQLIKDNITKETRNVILSIKSQVHNNPQYHKGFSSVDIYQAVLLEKVKDINGFKDYLTKQGRSYK